MILLSTEEQYKQILKPENRDFELALTSGCFDLIHSGHIYFLTEMQQKTHGAKQLVVIHDDESVKQHKGEDRPILSVSERAVVLDALKGVDYVLIWHGWENIVEMVLEIEPNYLVSSQGKIDEAKWENSWSSMAEKIGAKLVPITEIDHESSTTELINRIQHLRNDKTR